MNIVNEDIIRKLLSVNNNNAKITDLKWDVNNKILNVGNNYMSEVSRLTIEYVKDGDKTKRHIFLKVPFNSPMYEIGYKFHAYQRELKMYTEILPQLYDIDGEYFWPRYYHSDEKHSLFLKDLTQSGYKVPNRNDQLDFDHCCYALKCLARLHGLSVKVEKTRGIPEDIRKDSFYNRENTEMEIINHFLSGITKFHDSLDPTIQKKYTKQIRIFKSTSWEDLLADISARENSFNVLNHGDCWTNNIMFKYDAYGIIKKAKLLDFQISRWGSPALDVIFFTITSMRFDVYVEHYNLLLGIYLDTLNKILKTLECGEYTMEELKKDIEERYRFAVVVLTCLLPVILNDPEDPVDMSEIVKHEEIDMSKMDKTYRNKHYIDISTKWFLHLAGKGGKIFFKNIKMMGTAEGSGNNLRGYPYIYFLYFRLSSKNERKRIHHTKRCWN